jgi:cell division protein FtsB
MKKKENKKTRNFFFKLLINLYSFAVIEFVLIIVSFLLINQLTDHSLAERIKLSKTTEMKKQELKNLKFQINSQKDSIHLLQTDDDFLERYARERYKMKRQDEDIFLVNE